MGTSISQFITDLKPVQLKDLNAEFEQLPTGKAQPERFTRVDQQKRQTEPDNASASDEGNGEEDSANVEEPGTIIDSYDLADEVSLLDKIPKDFYDNLVFYNGIFI